MFFGTWSEQSQKHITEAERLYTIYREQGLTILGITSESNQRKVKDFAEKNGIDFPLLVDGIGILRQYEVGGVPDTYCITKYGCVCERLVGYDPEIETTLEKVIKLMVKKVDFP
jgi:peroxiredoxin